MSIVATTQQSRFHTETLDGTSDVDLRGLNLTVGDKELLVDAHLRLFSGQHYGLVGRNGSGKTSLLKAIGYGLVIGFPQHVSKLYVDQLEGVDASQTPLHLVLAADTSAQRAQREVELLQGALEEGDAAGMGAALHTLRLQRLQDEVEEARKIAELRSGERGVAARQALVSAEERWDRAQEAQQEGAEGAGEDAGQALQVEVDALFEKLALREPEEAERQAAAILRGLGLTPDQQQRPLGELSGGWRIRVSLAQALFLQPDLLLLDEPTNHLDLQAIVWLQRYLNQLQHTTLVVVSHDRAFLNAVAQEIIVLRSQRLSYHSGNYDEYVQKREAWQAHQTRLSESIQRKKQHMEHSIQEGLRQAQKKGDDKKLGMVASRKKKLEARLGMEKNAVGHRLKVNKDLVGFFHTARHQAEVEAPDQLPVWKVPEVAPLRTKGALLQAEKLSCGYDTGGGAVLQDVTLSIEQDDRVAMVGPNGQGKTTLVRTLLGELTPVGGAVQKQGALRVSAFRQSQVEELGSMGRTTPLDYLQEEWPQVKEQELRNHLGSFGIKGSTAIQPHTSLSGGQAVRVALAAAFFSRPNLLVLDEPSNHLDLEGVECLVEALGQYQGAVLLVSHDQFLIEKTAQRVFLVAGGGIRRLEGGVKEYVRELGSGARKGGGRACSNAASAAHTSSKTQGGVGAADQGVCQTSSQDEGSVSSTKPAALRSAAAARAAVGIKGRRP